MFHTLVLQEQEILEHALQSGAQDEIACDTDVQVSEMTAEDKLETIFPHKEIPLDAELITIMADGQVKSNDKKNHRIWLITITFFISMLCRKKMPALLHNRSEERRVGKEC